MALQHLRSSTANKRPTPAAMSDGQLAMNTNLASPGLFLKDSNGDLVKVGPVHVGTTAPNATPAAGGQAGNSVGEQWLDTSSSRYVFKIWDGTAWRTEDGEFVNSSGDTMTGALVMDNQQQVRFRETTGNGTNFIAIQAPASVAADRTLTLPDVTGTIVSTGDTGTVTSTMILDGTILNADVNASAAIAGTKISPDFGSQTIATTGVFSHALGAAATPSITFTGDLNTGVYSPGADQVAVATNGSGRLFINSTGLVGIGVTPSQLLHLRAASGSSILRIEDSGAVCQLDIKANAADGTANIFQTQNYALTFGTNNTERARIDSSGRLLVGTSSWSDRATSVLQGNSTDGATGPGYLVLSRGLAPGSLGAGNTIGLVAFTANNAGSFAQILCEGDGTVGTNDYPGRLVFSTTADGASSPTERMRISSNGSLTVTGVGGSAHSIATNSAERIRWNDNGSYITTLPTTGSGANAHIWTGSSPANLLMLSTSSQRYKTDIEDLDADRSNSILNFRPVWYRSTCELDRKDWSWYGLIAEEVAEIEPRLVHWTYLDDAYDLQENEDGTTEKVLKEDAELVPNGVQYDRLTVLLLDLAQRQEQRIAELEAAVAALQQS